MGLSSMFRWSSELSAPIHGKTAVGSSACCPSGHFLAISPVGIAQNLSCNRCSQPFVKLEQLTHFFSCATCDFDLCQGCAGEEAAAIPSAEPVAKASCGHLQRCPGSQLSSPTSGPEGQHEAQLKAQNEGPHSRAAEGSVLQSQSAGQGRGRGGRGRHGRHGNDHERSRAGRSGFGAKRRAAGGRGGGAEARAAAWPWSRVYITIDDHTGSSPSCSTTHAEPPIPKVRLVSRAFAPSQQAPPPAVLPARSPLLEGTCVGDGARSDDSAAGSSGKGAAIASHTGDERLSMGNGEACADDSFCDGDGTGDAQGSAGHGECDSDVPLRVLRSEPPSTESRAVAMPPPTAPAGSFYVSPIAAAPLAAMPMPMTMSSATLPVMAMPMMMHTFMPQLMMPPTLPHAMTGMAMTPSETIASVMPRPEVTTPAMVPPVSARAEVPPPREPHVGSTGASAPWLVTHGLTLRGAQLSWAILNGNKRVENRHFRMQPGWYALHTGAKTSSHESQLPLLAAVDGMPSEASLPHSAIIGALKVTHALTLDQCKPTEPWAFGPVVNVISAVCKLSQPVPARGRSRSGASRRT